MYSESSSKAAIIRDIWRISNSQSQIWCLLSANDGTRIWEWLQQPKQIKEIRALLLAEYNVAPEECDRDLQAIIQEMISAGLIEIVNEKAA